MEGAEGAEVKKVHPEKELPKISLPENLHLHFRLASHSRQEDYGELDERREQIRNADIYSFEFPGWNGHELYRHNRIAKGDKAAYEERKKFLTRFKFDSEDYRAYALRQLDAIYGSQTKILFIDLPAGDSRRINQAQQFNNLQIPENLVRPTFEATISNVDSLLTQFGNINYEVDKGIMESLQLEFSNNKQLQGKNQVNMLIDIGSGHSRIVEALHRDYGEKVSEDYLGSFTESQQAYIPYLDGTAADLPESIKVEMLARFVAGVYVYSIVPEEFEKSLTEEDIESIIGTLSFDDCKKVIEEINNGKSGLVHDKLKAGFNNAFVRRETAGFEENKKPDTGEFLHETIGTIDKSILRREYNSESKKPSASTDMNDKLFGSEF